MPAAAPPLPSHVVPELDALGQRVRSARKAAGLAAASVAEAAGMSRMTLSRIERGEPSVTMGAYLGVIAALGLELRVVEPSTSVTAAASRGAHEGALARDGVPARIRIADYPQLAAVAWHAPGLTEVTAQEARGIYQRHWRHVDTAAIGSAEAELLALLGLPPPKPQSPERSEPATPRHDVRT